MTANYHPDGLTFEAITALQKEVDDELRREGYHVEPSPWTPCGRPTSPTHQRRNRRFSHHTRPSPPQLAPPPSTRTGRRRGTPVPRGVTVTTGSQPPTKPRGRPRRIVPESRIAGNHDHTTERQRPSTAACETATVSADNQRLYTPAEAAQILSVKETWLRRKAGTRSIPCTFLGRHLRFSAADLRTITEQGAQPARARRGRPRTT